MTPDSHLPDADEKGFEIYRLASAALSGELTEADAQRLSQLVADDAEARRLYLEFICDACNLRVLFTPTSHSPTPTTCPSTGEAEPASPSPTRSSLSSLPPPIVNSTVPAVKPMDFPMEFSMPSVQRPKIVLDPLPPKVIPWYSLNSPVGLSLISYTLGAIIMLIGLGLGAVVYVTHTTEIAARWAAIEDGAAGEGLSGAGATIPHKEKHPYVGRISGMVDCQWADPYLIPVNPRIRQGTKFALESGLMEITYTTGAKVILQGPCTYEVESPHGGYLAIGKLTASVASGQWPVASKKSAGGKSLKPEHSPLATNHSPLFTVRTPTAIITDLGTEFGVEVDAEGVSRTEIYSGTVIAVALETSDKSLTSVNGAEKKVHLTVGQVGVITRDAKITVYDLPKETSGFVHLMPSESAKPILVEEPASLIAQWNLAEGMGKVLYPAVGRYGGRMQGNVVWQKSGPPAVPQTSLWFGGGSQGTKDKATGTDFVNFGPWDEFSPASITVGFWAKAEENVKYEAMAMLGKYSIKPGSWEFGWSLPQFGCKLFWRVFVAASEPPYWKWLTARSNFTGEDFQDGNWHFIAGTYDQASGIMALYLDGELQATEKAEPGRALNSTPHDFNLGRRTYYGVPEPYRGYLGGPLFIRNRAFSPAEVKSYYQACLRFGETLRKAERR